MRPADLDIPAPGAARSLWLQDALAADAGAPCPPLQGNVVADVAIVGGGFAGLWTAVQLTEREPALRVTLLERDIVGGGASGRNGGFLSSSWHDLDALAALFGDDEGLRYAQVLAASVGDVATFCDRYGIDAQVRHEGVMGVKSGTWQTGSAGTPTALQRLGVADRIRHLELDEVRAIADSPRFVAGDLIPDNAICQPALLARGLRQLLLDRGVHVFERTAVARIEPSRPAVVRTSRGAVKADHVVLAVGAWAAGWPGFRRSFGIISDYVVATEPIPDRLATIGWTSHVGIADGRDWLYYLRPTDDGRIVIGGGAGGAVFGGRAGGPAATHRRHFADAVARGLLWMFPQLDGVRFTHAWGGPIDQTPTFVPFYRTLPPGNVYAGLGFSGHGLTQTFVGGHILASTVLGRDDEWTSLAVNRPESSLAPPEPLRWPLVRLSALALERGDARQDRGRSRGLAWGAIGAAPLWYREHLLARAAKDRAAKDRELGAQ